VPASAPSEATLVDIVRDFLRAHGELRRIAGLWRVGQLGFSEVASLVADNDEDAVLFRLKERCHALFRGEAAVGREALLDLAIGALFHECMKFRENLYQHAVYGPKVRTLKASTQAEGELFREFEKILGASRIRLEEALHEAEILLQQCSVEVQALIGERPGDHLVTRFLLEHRSQLPEVFGADLGGLLAEVHGSSVAGLEVAGRSYLSSGYYREALGVLEEALSEAPGRSDLERLRHYAEGMQAYLERDYRSAVEQLDRWLEASPPPDEAGLASLAFTALSRIDQLVDEAGRAQISEPAARLAARIQPHASRARDSGSRV
jgi:tetratricopeptide (TPR) repeat protein